MKKRRRKKQKIQYPLWMLERSMTPTAFQACIDELGMTQAGAGRFLGVSERTARRYANGDAIISAAEAMLLRGMADRRETPLVPKWKVNKH